MVGRPFRGPARVGLHACLLSSMRVSVLGQSFWKSSNNCLPILHNRLGQTAPTPVAFAAIILSVRWVPGNIISPFQPWMSVALFLAQPGPQHGKQAVRIHRLGEMSFAPFAMHFSRSPFIPLAVSIRRNSLAPISFSRGEPGRHRLPCKGCEQLLTLSWCLPSIWHRDNGQEQSKLADRLGELFVFHRFGHVDIAA